MTVGSPYGDWGLQTPSMKLLQNEGHIEKSYVETYDLPIQEKIRGVDGTLITWKEIKVIWFFFPHCSQIHLFTSAVTVPCTQGYRYYDSFNLKIVVVCGFSFILKIFLLIIGEFHEHPPNSPSYILATLPINFFFYFLFHKPTELSILNSLGCGTCPA